MKLSHVSIAVDDLEKFTKLYSELFGIKFSSPQLLENQKVNLCFGDTEGARLEITSPSAPDSPVSKYLDKKGPGLHHLCLEVENLEETLKYLSNKRVELIGSPSIGSSGKKIIFLHPRSTGGILIELKQK
ncbi:MAG: methylmalonyl-CoA epimerase [candidate division Zixibacteria bacterium]|nr:methylmalonyl-CoA epimerase [candidate division Zixibacteria bacterium]